MVWEDNLVIIIFPISDKKNRIFQDVAGVVEVKETKADMVGLQSVGAAIPEASVSAVAAAAAAVGVVNIFFAFGLLNQNLQVSEDLGVNLVAMEEISYTNQEVPEGSALEVLRVDMGEDN